MGPEYNALCSHLGSLDLTCVSNISLKSQAVFNRKTSVICSTDLGASKVTDREQLDCIHREIILELLKGVRAKAIAMLIPV